MSPNEKKIRESLLATAQIHVNRLQYAMNKLKNKYPLTGRQVEKLSEEDLLIWELLANRFVKLQDLMGNKIFNLYLDAAGENFETWTMIDKVNKLEKLGIIQNADIWTNMRLLRNHLAHEYPEHPDLTAKYLNQTFTTVPKLIDCLNKLIIGFQKFDESK